jgi:hypothetical protein
MYEEPKYHEFAETTVEKGKRGRRARKPSVSMSEVESRVVPGTLASIFLAFVDCNWETRSTVARMRIVSCLELESTKKMKHKKDEELQAEIEKLHQRERELQAARERLVEKNRQKQLKAQQALQKASMSHAERIESKAMNCLHLWHVKVEETKALDYRAKEKEREIERDKMLMHQREQVGCACRVYMAPQFVHMNRCDCPA